MPSDFAKKFLDSFIKCSFVAGRPVPRTRLLPSFILLDSLNINENTNVANVYEFILWVF
jgi:hypothetical protein